MVSTEEKLKLDSLIEEVFKKLEDLSTLRRQLDQELRDGYLHMAKARSNLGQKSIGAAQYDDREIVPSVMVDVEENDSTMTFEMMRNTLINDSEEKNAVRKRALPKSDVETVGTADVNSDSKDSEPATKTAVKDPLLMFGVLVPQALRLSKSCFQRSLPVVSKICSTQAEILRLKAQYKSIRGQAA